MRKERIHLLCLQRTTSNKLEVCEALLRRAILNNQERGVLDELYWRMLRGQEGELRADHFWDDLQLNIPHRLFHNVETSRDGRFYHQMDTVFVCERFVLILELKNIAGQLFYEEKSNQLWREYNGRQQALGDPFSQVMRHEVWMQQFLRELGVDLPVVTAVVVTSSSAILMRMPKRFHVFKLEGLRMKLAEWLNVYPKKINLSVLQVLEEELLKRHEPRKWQHPLGDVKIRNGALCSCSLKMFYEHGKFRCACGVVSRTALFEGLYDYRLLYDEWITNQAFRAFFEIENMQVVNKILKRLGLVYEGRTKSRRYYIPADIRERGR